MITYKDQAFCASKVDKHTCGRELTDKDKKEAQKIGLPIAFGEFCTPQAHTESTLAEKDLNDELCKGCGEMLKQPKALNALSRYGHGYICSSCGENEAFAGDFLNNRI